jgi:two-component system phosphate regulon response regulator OmpR
MVGWTMANSVLIYLVDDDAEASALLRQYLVGQGFDVLCLAGAEELLQRLKRQRPDLVVLDLMMPGIDGREALRTLREAGDDLPLILLTALCDEEERIAGLDLGADDYLGKPFNPRELVSRIHAVLRRRKPPRHSLPEAGACIAIGAYILDPQRCKLFLDGNPVGLSPGDFAILRALVSNPYKPMSRDRLLEMTGQQSSERLGRTIDVQIVRLRRLIEPDVNNPTLLQTVRGVGYMFVPSESIPARTVAP